jgi:hypothetical protein
MQRRPSRLLSKDNFEATQSDPARKMRYLAAVFMFMLVGSAIAAKLFRYRGAADDGGTLEYIFETDQRDVPATVTKDKVAEIAAEFMATFYQVQVGALETQELRTAPTPFWLVCFSDTIEGRLRQLFFVVVMPDGTVVEPRVARRL